jgi:hypothetical protein
MGAHMALPGSGIIRVALHADAYIRLILFLYLCGTPNNLIAIRILLLSSYGAEVIQADLRRATVALSPRRSDTNCTGP